MPSVIKELPKAGTLDLRVGGAMIPFIIGDGGGFSTAARALDADKWIIIASEQPRVREHAKGVAGTLSRLAPAEVITLGDGERFKSIHTVERLCREVIERGATRSSVVVTVGGGNACNIGGLCAALLYRGIRMIQVPTTLMAMSDVVLSLKQGVNLAGMKNMLGTYHVAELVWADPKVLVSLPPQEIRAGLAEIVKNAMVLTPHHIDTLRSILNPSANYPVSRLATFLEMAIESKSIALQDDPKERGRALVLEYGHTIGHALEAISSHRITHGVSVSLGMRVAVRVSHQLGLLDERVVGVQDDLLACAGLPRTAPVFDDDYLSRGALRAQLLRDNKRGYLHTADDEVAMVLMTEPGVPATTGDLPLTSVPVDVIVELANDALR